MKTKLCSFLLIASALLLAGTTVACGSSTSDEQLRVKRELAQELWELLMDYDFELAGVEAIRNESIAQVSDALKSGTISTLKYGNRIYQDLSGDDHG